MSAPALLADLEAVGIHITREGDNMRVRANPGVLLSPHVDQLRANKPALLRELLQRQIIAALDVEPHDFDRRTYERLCMLWHTEDMKEEFPR
jgi:hypothetical protein